MDESEPGPQIQASPNQAQEVPTSKKHWFKITPKMLILYGLLIFSLTLLTIFCIILIMNEKITITGSVYHDKNQNQMKEPEEDGVESITIKLRASDSSVLETTTDSTGSYLFNERPKYKKLKKLDYTVEIVPIENFRLSSDGSIERTDSTQTVDFGLACDCVLGIVFFDENENLVREEVEKGISNVTIELYTHWGTTLYANSNEEGFYIFPNLPSNTSMPSDNENNYSISIVTPLGYESRGGIVAQAFRLPPDLRLDFALNYQSNLYGIYGFVFIDNDRNNLRDSSEKGFKGAKVALYRGGSGGTILTEEDGAFYFPDLYEGYGSIILKVPEEYESTGPGEKGNFVNKLIKIVPNEQSIEFGIAPSKNLQLNVNPSKTHRITGSVFIDENRNGIKDPNERVFSNNGRGAFLSLTGFDKEFSDVTDFQVSLLSNTDGVYSTEQLLKNTKTEPPEGIYLLSMNLPEGYEPTIPLDRAFTLNSDLTIDFGITPK